MSFNQDNTGIAIEKPSTSPTPSASSSQPKRNIFYLIFDRYGSSEVISKFYDYDNSEFIKFLKEYGFYIPPNAVANYHKTSWSLSSSLNMEYINYLELLAIFYALPEGCRDDNSCHIQVMTDNMTAVSGILKQGSTRSLACNAISRKVWLQAVDRDIWLTAAHIPGVENNEADQESSVFRED